MAKSEIKWIRLGEFLEKHEVACGNNDAVVSGVNINKEFIRSRANLIDTDISSYTSVKPRYFAANLMHIGRDERIPIAYNNSDKELVVTSAYSVFRVKLEKHQEILDDYIFLFFNSKEIDRLAWFYTDGSVRGNLQEARLFDIRIPVPFKDGKPDIEQQKIVVDAWQGLRKMKEDNEQLVEPLMQLCRSYMEDLKKRYIPTRIGQYIEQCNTRNYILQSKNVRGMSTQKEFRVPQSRVDFNNLGSYKIVQHNEFVFVPTTDTWRCLAIAYNKEDSPIVVSPIYCVFKIDEKILLPDYLHLYFKRSEFDRYARFHSWGSARENFNFDDMCNVKIPIPDINVQQAIVDIYRCAEKAKHIAEEADRLSREICPALMQHIIQTSKS